MLNWGRSQPKSKDESNESGNDLYDELETLVVSEQQKKQRIRQLKEVVKVSESAQKASG